MPQALNGSITLVGVDDHGDTYIEFNGPDGVTISLSEEQRLGLLAALSEMTLVSGLLGRAPPELQLERFSARPIGDGRDVVLDFQTEGGWTVSLLTPRAELPSLRATIQQLEAGAESPSVGGMN